MNRITLAIAILAISMIFIAWKPITKYTLASAQHETQASVTAPYRKITPQEAKTLMDSRKDLIVLDVRTPAEFAEGHIEHAINLANETIGSTRPSLLPDLDATILVYCRSGARSAQASRKLLALGYTQVYDFGGILNWPYDIVRLSD
ncbi:MAG: rhodanese-like domain-containing protein [Sphaerochaeta sp.]|nr:rhodanese-like domain-containing protein [Sphaerochaeta sp.]